MELPINKKLVIAVSSSALFDLSESHEVFLSKGEGEYKKFQEDNLDVILGEGVAFPFIKRFLSLNKRFPDLKPVEVILLSRNSVSTGKRVFRSINHYGLGIERASFQDGKSPFEYIPAFNASLFLTGNEVDVKKAIEAGYPAGLVLPNKELDKDTGEELRIAFDYDGVIIDDEAEAVYKKSGLESFKSHEEEHSDVPHNQGLLMDLFQKINVIQQLEEEQLKTDPEYKRILRTAIITARGAPSHERVITTLESWGVNANEVFFLAGMAKENILSVLKPHIFFDDQLSHLQPGKSNTPMVHIPFGVANNSNQKGK